MTLRETVVAILELNDRPVTPAEIAEAIDVDVADVVEVFKELAKEKEIIPA